MKIIPSFYHDTRFDLLSILPALDRSLYFLAPVARTEDDSKIHGKAPSTVFFFASRFTRIAVVALCALLFAVTAARSQTDPLPSWNEGPTKKAIIKSVSAITTEGSPDFVPPGERFATF